MTTATPRRSFRAQMLDVRHAAILQATRQLLRMRQHRARTITVRVGLRRPQVALGVMRVGAVPLRDRRARGAVARSLP